MRPVSNPPNPFAHHTLEWDGPEPPAELQLFEEHAKSVLSKNDSPDIGFEYSLNPYRGCFHACAYCYARPTHQYLDFGAGTDFDRKIVVKVNAPERLREAFRKPSWLGRPLVFSGNTDCYQPIEAHYELTKRCLEVCAEFKNPVYIITKSKLVRRDAQLLGRLAREADARVAVSIPFASDDDARLIEPFASPPSKRFETLRVLHDAGVPTTVSLAPLIPGLNDSQIPEVLERAREAGADKAFITLVRLAREVRPVFEQRLRESFPQRADKVLRRLAEMREGQTPGQFHTRMRGEGEHYQLVEQLFRKTALRLGYSLHDDARPLGPSPFVRPIEPRRQLELFNG